MNLGSIISRPRFMMGFMNMLCIC